MKESEDFREKVLRGEVPCINEELLVCRDYSPLEVSPEIEFLLNLPVIPSGASLEEIKVYTAARHLKFNYKLLRLTGVCCEEDLNLLYPNRQRQAQIRQQMLKHNGTSKNAVEVFYTLIGRAVAFDKLLSYPFLNKDEIERSKTPYEYLQWRKEEEEKITRLRQELERELEEAKRNSAREAVRIMQKEHNKNMSKLKEDIYLRVRLALGKFLSPRMVKIVLKELNKG